MPAHGFIRKITWEGRRAQEWKEGWNFFFRMTHRWQQLQFCDEKIFLRGSNSQEGSINSIPNPIARKCSGKFTKWIIAQLFFYEIVNPSLKMPCKFNLHRERMRNSAASDKLSQQFPAPLFNQSFCNTARYHQFWCVIRGHFHF